MHLFSHVICLWLHEFSLQFSRGQHCHIIGPQSYGLAFFLLEPLVLFCFWGFFCFVFLNRKVMEGTFYNVATNFWHVKAFTITDTVGVTAMYSILYVCFSFNIGQELIYISDYSVFNIFTCFLSFQTVLSISISLSTVADSQYWHVSSLTFRGHQFSSFCAKGWITCDKKYI